MFRIYASFQNGPLVRLYQVKKHLDALIKLTAASRASTYVEVRTQAPDGSEEVAYRAIEGEIFKDGNPLQGIRV